MKTVIKSILSACVLTLFAVSVSLGQGTGTGQSGQTSDAYDQDNTYQGTTQEGTTQDGMEKQDTKGQLGQNTQGEENKTQIAKEELPSEVSNAIDQGEYSEWTVAEAYEINREGEKQYEVHFETPEGQTEKETFNESGNIAR